MSMYKMVFYGLGTEIESEIKITDKVAIEPRNRITVRSIVFFYYNINERKTSTN